MSQSEVNVASVPGVKDMLTRLISLPSISSASAKWDHSNEAVVRILAEWLEPLGFAVEILEVPGMPGKFNLIATLGSGPGGLVLSGHTDTVPPNGNGEPRLPRASPSASAVARATARTAT